MDNKNDKPLINFPCTFPIKVIGLMQDGFAQEIASVIKKIDTRFDESCIEMQPSSKNNYLSLTVNVYVVNQKQLDDIYRVLSSHSLVKFVL
jgi:putative lipoic acid-binding regulatory protein